MTATIRGPATARRVLEEYLGREDAEPWLAEKARALLDVLPLDPGRVAALVLGDQTPKGKPTFEALVSRQVCREIPVPAPAPESSRPRRGGRKLDFGELDRPVAAPTFPELPRETRPADPLTLVEQGPEGGATTPSSEYRHHELRHPTLNPIQSLALPWVERDVNVVVAAATSAGKTLLAELFMGEALARGASAAFLSPLRAVSQEKHDDWTDEAHPWSRRRVAILTGDYQLTAARKKELQKADVVVLTSEMLDSRSRRMESGESAFLYRVGALVVDESHLLTMEGRGDALEAGIMRFTAKNPRARVVLLSATMPNVEELGRWLTRLNGRPTVVLRSLWRPTKLTVWWPTYPSGGAYQVNEDNKREAALAIVKRFPRDKFIVFVHSKKAGWSFLERAKRLMIRSEFHNADLVRDSRLALERDFRDGDLRVVVATSTLAYGVNMPARRVIVLGVHRGIELVDPIDVKQMCGRAGRMGLDPEGDAYVLLPDRQAKTLRPRFETVGPIVSRLHDEDALAFHLTAEVAENGMRSEAEAVAWHGRSFAAVQGQKLPERGVALAPPGSDERMRQIMRGEADELSADRVLSRLAKVGILKVEEVGSGREPDLPKCERCGGFLRGDKRDLFGCSDHEQAPKVLKTYQATQLGRVASWLYFSPFDVADWASNFRRIASADLSREDAPIAWALGHVKTSLREARMPRELEVLASKFAESLRARGIEFFKITQEMLAYRALLRGEDVRELAAIKRALYFDLSRTVQAVRLIDSRVLRALPEGYPELLLLRLQNGVGWTEAELCRLPGIGGKRASILVARGITSIADVAARAARVRATLPGKVAEEAIAAARNMLT